jgi:hypothetical protein
MPDTPMQILSDTTLVTTLPYAALFALAKQAAASLGGKLKTEDAAAGTLQFKYRYGINPTGIRVDIQFRRRPGDETELVVTGRIGDSFDTLGAGKERGRAVLNEIARQIDTAAPGAQGSAPWPSPDAARAPILGQGDVQHRGKSKTVAVLLALFLGGLGIHRFYLGSWGLGLVLLGLTLVGLALAFPLGVILSLGDCARLIFMKRPNFDAAFNFSRVGPFTF